MVTARDELTIDMDRGALWLRVQDFTKLAAEALRDKYKLGEDARDWTVEGAKADVTVNFGQNYLMPIAYRPFDTRWTYYTGNSRGFLCYPREEVMRHLADHENISMMLPKQTKDGLGALVCAHIAGHKAFSGSRYYIKSPALPLPPTLITQDILIPAIWTNPSTLISISSYMPKSARRLASHPR
ncbi:type ISP restriction/modification enzyme [Novosphingobium colocasiae]